VSLEARLFGGFELRVGHRSVRLPTRQCRLLVAYLFSNGPRPHQRTLLAGLFWPERPERRALRNLSDALWRSARALETAGCAEAPWERTTSTVRLKNDAGWCDVRSFRNLVSQRSDPEAWAQAIELYRGEYLEGFYQDWCLRERDWLRDRYAETLRRLVQTRTEQGLLDEALLLGQRWCATTPWSEDAHRHVMIIQARLGRLDQCMAQYVRCAEALAQEFDGEPSDETQRLYRSLLKRNVRRSTGSAQTPLVGRAPERSVLWGVMERAERGRGGVVLLHGEAGVGKTRLMEELAKMATFRGARVVRVWCGNAGEPGWGTVRQLVRGVASGVGSARAQEALGKEWNEVVRPLIEGDRPVASGNLARVVVDSLMAAAAGRPHLLLWDDLHEVDNDSMDLLLRIAARITAARCLVVASLRRADAKRQGVLWRKVQELASYPGVELLSVGPLSREESAELALVLDATLGEEAGSLAAASEGNPLLLGELLRDRSDGGARLDSRGGRLLDVLRSRMATLHAPARRVMEVLALVGGPVAHGTLTAAAGLGTDVALSAVEELLFRELLLEEREGVRCAHQWVVEAVRALTPRRRRKELAVRSAQVLAAGGGAPERVATLLILGGRRTAAVPFLLAAGKSALRAGAPAAAAEYLTKAAGMKRVLPARYRLPLLEARAAARHQLGDRRREATDTAGLLTLAQAQDDPGWMARALLARATYCRKSGRVQEGRRLADRARVWARKSGDRRCEATALCLGAELDLHFGAFRAARRKFDSALRLGPEGLGPAETGSALEGAGEACLLRGQFPQARRLVEQGLALASRHDIGDLKASCLSALGAVHHALGQDWQALERFRDAAVIWRERRHRRREAVALTNVAVVLGKLGRHREGLDTIETACLLKQRLGDADSQAVTLLHKGTLLQGVGEFTNALRCFRRALSMFRRTRNQAWLAEAEGKVGSALCESGRPAEARKYLEASLERRQRLGDRYTLAGVVSQLALCNVRLGDDEEALVLSRRALRLTRGAGAAVGFGPMVLLNHYRILRAQGKAGGGEAERALAQALSQVRRQARAIPDKDYRRTFLRHNTEACAIMEARRHTRLGGRRRSATH
jgi:DNA-binding SARP family transcriptional activator/tetratricopeptide (TPR) repeat protein